MLSIFVFDDLYIADLVVVDVVLCHLEFIILFVFFLPALILFFSVLAKRLAGKSIPQMTNYVSSGTLNFDLLNQSITNVFAVCNAPEHVNADNIANLTDCTEIRGILRILNR